MWLQPPRLGGIEPIEVEPDAALKLERMTQRLGVVAVERDDQRPFVAVLAGNPGRRCELAGEVRPQALAFERQRQERLLARLRLGCGGEHPRCRPARASPGFA